MSTTIKFAGKDPDGNAKAVAVDASGNVGVNMGASDIVLPVDLQAHAITSATPIPVTQTDGSYEELLQSNKTIAAGVRASLTASSVDMSKYKSFTLAIRAGASHTFTPEWQFRVKTAGVHAVLRKTVTDAVTTDKYVSAEQQLLLIDVVFFIQNTSASDQVYDIHVIWRK